MDTLYKSMQQPLIWVTIILFVIFYPMFISIYVFLPLLIGVMGYILMLGIEKGKFLYILVSVLYFINLEVNLSLPFFLTIISALLVYVLFYQYLTHFRKCRICKPILSALLLDAVYLGSLLSYDFIFQSHSIVLDNILLYSLIVDLLVVVIL
ncbi:hypothetical protein [Sulfurovum sp.]|uniref:hypothetical protein n=1 Tax=Sulfurovum sp. TaxID=1969726 RepID=UPI0025E787C3|nr:hypothetical protein [Sulfurovum sp.]